MEFKKYSTILFDLDDTLLDFYIDQEIAFKAAIKIINEVYTEKLYNDYVIINNQMWKLLEEGKITVPELLVKRFEILFEKYNIKEEAVDFEKKLTLEFQKTGTTITGVKELLDNLKDKYELVIASNGPKSQQYNRLENSGIKKYFSKIFISEEVGYNKPDIRYFNKVLDELDNKDKAKIIIIGDSIVSDVKGGNEFGIDTCWYNKNSCENITGIKPTYEITNIKEIKI